MNKTLAVLAAPLVLVPMTLVALASPARAADPDPRAPGVEARDRLAVLVERVKREQAKVRTLEARFVQHQETAFLLAPEESRGTFAYMAPDRVRWEYDAPKPVTMVIDGKEMTTWYRDLGRVDVMKIGKQSEKVLRFLGAGGSMSSLLEYFDVRAAFPKDTKAPYRLDLTPRYERVAKRLKSLTIWIDPVRYLPSRLRYESGDGAITEYIFEAVAVNGEITAERFQLKFPAGVEVRVVDLDRAP